MLIPHLGDVLVLHLLDLYLPMQCNIYGTLALLMLPAFVGARGALNFGSYLD